MRAPFVLSRSVRAASAWTRGVAVPLALPLSLAAVVAPASTARAQAAQQTGRVVGRVIDAGSGAGITGVGVQVVGTTLGAQSGVDGRFTILNVPAGSVTVQARRIGYSPKGISGVQVVGGQAVEQVISLQPATVQLEAVTVSVSAERGTVNEALDRQRTATGVVNSITSQQIAQSPDGDAAQAVQRVSGVTVQDGRYVFVRGLGERYTTASINGARLPSPEPERKVVPLDLFPAGLLQSITTSKTFTPDQSGDFSGAQVNIETREFPARRVVTYSTSLGMNDAATGRNVLGAPTLGREWLGFGGSARALPGTVAAQGDFRGRTYTQTQFNELGRSLRNAWTPATNSGRPNSSFGATAGGEAPVFGQRVGYVGSLTYGYSQEVRQNERTSLARGGSTEGSTEAINQFAGSTGRTSVLWGGLANFSTLLGTRSRLALNNMYNRTADNEARRDEGRLEDVGLDAIRSTLRFVERTVRSNQLLGEHELGGASRFDWSLTQSGVTRAEPDRADLVYIRPELGNGAFGTPRLYSESNEAARRTYGDLTEQAWNLAANFRYGLGDASKANYLKVGGALRDVDRDASNVAYSLYSPVAVPPTAVLELPAEQLFTSGALADTARYFQLQPFAGGGSYAARDRVGAGYLMGDYGLTSRIRLIAGARVESWQLRLRTQPVDGSGLVRTNREITDVLPSLAANVRLTDNQSLRLSASQTLARPEYRELAPLLYLNVIGGERGYGNASLRRTLIQNADLRYEFYPAAGEVFSVALFGKRFDDPIERVTVATSGTQQFTFINANGANNYGVELEARKGLGALLAPLDPITAFANVTVMRSDITPGNGQFATLTSTNRPMVGQAPYVVNVGGTYAAPSGRTTATVLYNVVGKRVFSAGAAPLPDVYEMPRNVLDVALRFPVYRSLSAKVDAKNLLDAPYRWEQGTVTRERYNVGRAFTLGLSWQP